MAGSTRVGFRLGLGAVSLVASLGGCSDDATGPETLRGSAAILSDPVRGTVPLRASPGGTASSSATATTYASLPAGAVSRGMRAVIRLVGSGFSLDQLLTDGGLDPVAVQAAVGDTVETLATDGTRAHSATPVKVKGQP